MIPELGKLTWVCEQHGTAGQSGECYLCLRERTEQAERALAGAQADLLKHKDDRSYWASRCHDNVLEANALRDERDALRTQNETALEVLADNLVLRTQLAEEKALRESYQNQLDEMLNVQDGLVNTINEQGTQLHAAQEALREIAGLKYSSSLRHISDRALAIVEAALSPRPTA